MELDRSWTSLSYYISRMMDGQAKKMKRHHNHSLIALASNSQGENTKKSIETDEIGSVHPTAMGNNRKFVFSLPFSTEVAALVSALSLKFAASLLHAQSNSKSALLVLDGLKMRGIRRALGKLLDYLIFCCSRGMKYGILEESYNVVVITIRREVIDNRCLVSVANPYPKEYLAQFASEVLDPIEEQLKTLGKQLEAPQEGKNLLKNTSLYRESPCSLQMHVCQKIYHLFVFSEYKQFEKYKLFLNNSLQIVRGERERYLEKLSSSLTKNSLPSPSGLVEVFVVESQNLMACLHNSYRQENHEGSFLHSLLTSECMQEISLYKIQQVLCLYELPAIREIFLKHSKEQSQAFNSNVELVNAEFTDHDCFEHLQLRLKYRLPSEKRPYLSGIQQLRRIEFCASLREMLLVIQECFSKVKSDCLAAYGGREELASMDDLLPVMIFVTVRAGILNFPAIVRMVDDYVRFKNVFELEERVITTLQVAIEDISRKWTKKEENAGVLNSC